MKFDASVHGAAPRGAKVDGTTVAVSRKRASYGQDILWQLGFRDLTTGKVDSAATLRDAMSDLASCRQRRATQRHNAIRHVVSGTLPVRNGSRRRLPTKAASQLQSKASWSRPHRSRSIRRPARS